ncbi:hypothetical protein [Bacillus alkalicellulosilyticus]|uniref:hypothetical protein n=1 Tax=Alkalihalobacterium alkalicellulosilyticum TaxID=1912214 RepID=UPI0009984FF0|nr:hypothetical protein [Bacillus alkalicellulosilyticus]
MGKVVSIKRGIFFVLIGWLLSGCVIIEGNSLKSHVEIEYNKMFGTEFDYLGTIRIYNEETKQLVKKLEAEAFLDFILHSEPEEFHANNDKDYRIMVTAIQDPDYRKGQMEAILYLDYADQVICNEENNKCIKVGKEVMEVLQ